MVFMIRKELKQLTYPKKGKVIKDTAFVLIASAIVSAVIFAERVGVEFAVSLLL